MRVCGGMRAAGGGGHILGEGYKVMIKAQYHRPIVTRRSDKKKEYDLSPMPPTNVHAPGSGRNDQPPIER